MTAPLFVILSFLGLPVRGQEMVLVEAAYIQHLASIADDLNSGNSEIDFWRKLSGLSDPGVSVWSITNRTFGSAVAANSSKSVVAPARLLSDGDGCNIWQIREKSGHTGLHKRLTASIRTRDAGGSFTDYECRISSILIGRTWHSAYWTMALDSGVISSRGRFPEEENVTAQ